MLAGRDDDIHQARMSMGERAGANSRYFRQFSFRNKQIRNLIPKQ